MRTAPTSHAAPRAGPGCSAGGVLLLDKPAGMTSQAAVSRVKRLVGCMKAGHTGTLDPLATGLLPVCIGEATKFSHLLLDAEKTYEAGVRLGVVTTTGDREGSTLSVVPVDVDLDAVQEVLSRFVGEIIQVPPMYSALKRRGQPLYKLARRGISVSRPARTVRIRSLQLRALAGDLLHISIVCGKGTYIRVLAEDIGRALGCGASLDTLRRTAVGALSVEESMTFDVLETLSPEARVRRLLDPDTPVAGLPRIDLNAEEVRHALHGRTIMSADGREPGLVRLYDRLTGRFLGVGSRDLTGRIVPRRLMQASNRTDNA